MGSKPKQAFLGKFVKKKKVSSSDTLDFGQSIRLIFEQKSDMACTSITTEKAIERGH